MVFESNIKMQSAMMQMRVGWKDIAGNRSLPTDSVV